MSDTVIQVENLWKEYRLGVISHRTLTRDLQSWWARLRGNEDPNSRINYGLSQDTSHQSQLEDRFWAIQNISFEVKQGDLVGIIGRNGAGKSTLLKILSRVTAPTKGEVRFKGRIASLLEVGTGFHPELTGRENIFLNGAILGMSKADIYNKLDEIVAFAEIEKFLDTPVKRYSSGMYVRLAFAVAAHLEPEILIVDEVLAVGDAQFQKKCLGKMESVGKEGRTVLFVSHNMGAISNLTQRCIFLKMGQIQFDGETKAAVSSYIESSCRKESSWRPLKNNLESMQIMGVNMIDIYNQPQSEFDVLHGFTIQIEYEVRKFVRGAVIAINIHSTDGSHIVSLEDSDQNSELLHSRSPGRYRALVSIPGTWLNSGSYVVRAGCGIPGNTVFENNETLMFTLVETGDTSTRGHRSGYLLPMLKWRTESISPQLAP